MEPLACWIYRFTPTRPTMLSEGLNAAEMDAFRRHSIYLDKLVAEGVAILVGRSLNRDERNFALAIIQAASEDEARRVMENDPFVSEGVVQADLFPFQIVRLAAENAASEAAASAD